MQNDPREAFRSQWRDQPVEVKPTDKAGGAWSQANTEPTPTTEPDESEPVYVIDAQHEVWPERYQARVRKEWIDLTPTEMRVLNLLIDRAGVTWRRSQLVRACHGGYSPVSDRSVDFVIHQLRRKLGPLGGYIETVRGQGFRFACDSIQLQRRMTGLSVMWPALLWCMGIFQPRQWGRGGASGYAQGVVAAAGLMSLTTVGVLAAQDGWHGTPDWLTPWAWVMPRETPTMTLDAVLTLESDLTRNGEHASAVGGLSGLTWTGSTRDGTAQIVAISDAANPAQSGTPMSVLHRIDVRSPLLDQTGDTGLAHAVVAHSWAIHPPDFMGPALTTGTLNLDGPFLERPTRAMAKFEGITATPDGTFWIADEYHPRLLKVSGDGLIQRTVSLPVPFRTVHEGDRPLAFDAAHGLLPLRGINGVSIDPTGRYLFAIGAAPLAQDGGTSGLFLRLLRVDLTDHVMHTFVVPLAYPYNVATDLVAIDQYRLLMIETDSSRIEGLRYATVQSVDLHQAHAYPAQQHLPRSAGEPDWTRAATKHTLMNLHDAIGQVAPGITLAGKAVQGITVAPDGSSDGSHVWYAVTDNEHEPGNPTRVLTGTLRWPSR